MFEHIYLPPSEGEVRHLLVLHGTGGSEHDLIGIAQQLAPGFGVISPRGRVKEMGMNRWFKRFAEGQFDFESIGEETEAFSNWIAGLYEAHGIDPSHVTPLGYSNGANMGAATLSRFPDIGQNLVMWRGMATVEPKDLTGKNILMLNGERDPMAPLESVKVAIQRFQEAGANVESQFLGTGHGLTEADFQLSSDWIKKSTEIKLLA